MNRPLHKSVFHVWWDHVDGSTGKLVRSDKVDHGAAGCYQLTESREVAKDGKATVTSVRQDIWTFQEIAAMSQRAV